jgi:hypothetical protein
LLFLQLLVLDPARSTHTEALLSERKWLQLSFLSYVFNQ